LAELASKLRPNPARSIEVFGDFNDELAAKLLSEVARLRAAASSPITVYINSFGGGIRILDIIDGTLRCSDLDQNSCLFVTVAVGNAASAGANLLAFGNYAYAYEHSLIHFHGAHSSDLPDTFENVSQMATELQRLNRKISQRLAQSIIARIIFRYQSLKPEFSRKRIKKDASPELAEVLCFLRAISPKLSVPARRLINATWNNVKKASALSHKILPRAVPKMSKKATQAGADAKVLIEVIRHELRENRGKSGS
jgi:ATP-dependent protease ClpP protease subunit